MESSDIQVLLRGIGCSKIKVRDSWVGSTCPLAPWRHRGGRDKRPSFAVSISPGNTSTGYCFGCGWKGSVISLLWRLDHHGYDVDRFVPFVLSRDQPDLSENEEVTLVRKVRSSVYWGDSPQIKYGEPETPKAKPISEDFLRSLRAIPEPVLEHLADSRRLSPRAVAHWELGYSRRMHRIVVPIRNRDGLIVAMSGRSIGKRNPKYLHYPKGFKRNSVLFGEDKVMPGKVGYLHEGFFACIYAWQFGYENCVARMGTHLSGYQEDRLVEWFDRLMIVPDGDEAGYRSAEEIYERLRTRVPTEVASMPTGFEVDRLSENDLRKVMGIIESRVDSEVVAH